LPRAGTVAKLALNVTRGRAGFPVAPAGTTANLALIVIPRLGQNSRCAGRRVCTHDAKIDPQVRGAGFHGSSDRLA